jgi:hypothetical protein
MNARRSRARTRSPPPRGFRRSPKVLLSRTSKSADGVTILGISTRKCVHLFNVYIKTTVSVTQLKRNSAYFDFANNCVFEF